MPSFTRNSEALISFSYFKTVDQHSAGFWRTNNTTRGGESSIKQTVGVAKLWVNEVFDVSRVVGKQLLVQLPTIESKDKQLQGSL